jgi:hypothetical protein
MEPPMYGIFTCIFLLCRNLVSLDPDDLHLKFIEDDLGSRAFKATIRLTASEAATERIAFKVKTTAPNIYTVKPSQGIFEPGQVGTVVITLIGSPEVGIHKFNDIDRKN